MDFIGRYLDINSDEVIDHISNLKCWNNDAINRLNHQKELNNLDLRLSEIKEERDSREKSNHDLVRRLKQKALKEIGSQHISQRLNKKESTFPV